MQDQQPDQNKLLFINLVSMLAMSAMQQMGKIINPVTGKTETHLQAAQATIDMLDMIEARTAGNLDQDEARMLKDTLTSLKLNYVETSKTAAAKPAAKPAAAPADKPADQPQRDAAPAPEPAATPDAAAGNEDKREPKDPKFHKSYN